MLKSSMLKSSLAIFLIAASATFASAEDEGKVHQPKTTPQTSGTTQLLIDVSPVNDRVVWAAGTGGTFVVTTDGGKNWKAGVVPGAESLQFRDVHGVSDKIAYLMSIGNNTTDFKIYKTTDGGATWTIQFTNETMNAFYDCFAFWTPDRGVTHSDSVNGVFPDIRTRRWKDVAVHRGEYAAGGLIAKHRSPRVEPASQRKENGTPGSPPAVRPSQESWLTTDGGNSWNAYDTPLVSSPSAGGYFRGLPRFAATAFSAAVIWPRTLPLRRRRRRMAAKPGLLRTSRPCRGRFSAWPTSVAINSAMDTAMMVATAAMMTKDSITTSTTPS